VHRNIRFECFSKWHHEVVALLYDDQLIEFRRHGLANVLPLSRAVLHAAGATSWNDTPYEPTRWARCEPPTVRVDGDFK